MRTICHRPLFSNCFIEGPVPYTPPGQMTEIITRYRERGNPQVFDQESLGRLGVPDSAIARTLQALKVLDLVDDDGRPTQTFDVIRQAPQAELKGSEPFTQSKETIGGRPRFSKSDYLQKQTGSGRPASCRFSFSDSPFRLRTAL